MLQTVQRIGPLLDLFTVDRPEWGVSETAEALGVPRSSAHALLTSLADTGLLMATGRGRYRLGWRVVELYENMRAGIDLRSVAAPVLRWLNEQTGETTNLAVLDRGEVLYLDKVASRHQVAVAGLRVGSRVSAHCTGLGKALLAFTAPEQVAALLTPGPLRSYTSRTITDPDRLLEELAEIRRTGVAHESGEVVADVACVAAPVRDGLGQVIAAISLSGPAYRIEAQRPALASAVRAAAQQVSQRMAEAETAGRAVPFDDPSRFRPQE